MGDTTTPAQIRAALDAGEGPHAVRLAREFVLICEVDAMLDVSSAFADHASFGPLVDLWRRRLKDRQPDDREPPAFANALNGMASEHLSERRETEAMALLHEALELAPQLDYIRRNVASMLVHQGDYEAALLELDTLLTNSPTDPQARLLMGVARYQSGDPAMAVEHLELAFDAGFPDAGLWLAKALALLDKLDAARAALAQIHAAHPDRAASMIELELSEPGSPLQRLG